MQRCVSSVFLRRGLTSSATAKGVREQFNEYEVRWHFNRWLNSLWLAPNSWVYQTRDRSIKIHRRWLPFWNISLQGSIQCSLSTKSNSPFRHDETYYSQRRWHSFPLELKTISLNNVNIYAAESLDRYHVQRLDVSFDDLPLVELPDDECPKEIGTRRNDRVASCMDFDHQTSSGEYIYPNFDDPRIDSFHLKIHSSETRLLFYPVSVINYTYRSESKYTCLFDGRTGLITGDRQYSPIKVMLATLIAFYPMLKIGVFSVGFLADLLFAFEIASDVSFIVCLPMALIVGPCLGFYARSYPKRYRKELSEMQWKQDQSKVSGFTYELRETEKLL